MERIDAPLRDLIRRLGLEPGMRGWKAVELWPDVAGTRVAERSRAVDFRDGTLVVAVDHPAWMNELMFLRRRFTAELNRRLGEEIVREIRLELDGARSRGGAGRYPRGE